MKNSTVRKRISESFAKVKAVLGIATDFMSRRKIDLHPSQLESLNKEVASNTVVTSKYSVLSFLPVNLFQQMSKAANVYFLMITVLQTIKVISISNGEPTMLPPLILVVFSSMVKDAFEDYCRHSEDALENNALCTRFNRAARRFERVRWCEVKVGDYVQVAQDEFFPADLLLVRSSGEEGIAYVETKNLDGETNLKNKFVPKMLAGKFENPTHDIGAFQAMINCEGPNNFIYKFDGYMEVIKSQQDSSKLIIPILEYEKHETMRVPLSNDNVLLRGMSLRNTHEVLGIVLYTGRETKIQKNSAASVYKVSKMMKETNKSIFYIFLLQCVLSLVGAILCARWTDENIDIPYLAFKQDKAQYDQDLLFTIGTMTGSWILIFW